MVWDHPAKINLSMREQDEHIELLLRRHWITMLPLLVILLAGLLLPFIISLLGVDLFVLTGLGSSSVHFQVVVLVVWYMLVLGFGFVCFLNWFFNVYIVTDKHLIDVDYWGLFFHRISDCRLEQVQDTSHDVQGMWEILFNYGDVFVQTASELSNIDFISVSEPEFVHQRISDLVSQALEHDSGRHHN